MRVGRHRWLRRRHQREWHRPRRILTPSNTIWRQRRRRRQPPALAAVRPVTSNHSGADGWAAAAMATLGTRTWTWRALLRASRRPDATETLTAMSAPDFLRGAPGGLPGSPGHVLMVSAASAECFSPNGHGAAGGGHRSWTRCGDAARHPEVLMESDFMYGVHMQVHPDPLPRSEPAAVGVEVGDTDRDPRTTSVEGGHQAPWARNLHGQNRTNAVPLGRADA